MAKHKQDVRCIGILTAGGDCPGLNAAIRGVAKAAMQHFGMRVIGFQDGFRGLVENRYIPLTNAAVSGILTVGGTVLGSSRDKIAKMRVGDKTLDMTTVAAENLEKLQIDCLVCLGGGGTAKNAWNLHERTGVNVLTLPKTIDNDVAGTDITFGFHSALDIATEAIDRLHTTATSHHRIIVCEIMGHNAGWLTLGAGLAGGADEILIPEIPYSIEKVAENILNRRRFGKRFSIVAVAEGAVSIEEMALRREAEEHAKHNKKKKDVVNAANAEGMMLIEEPKASRLARELQQLTGIDARVTTLGHVQRGGAPSPYDRLLCSLFGTYAARFIADGQHNVMTALKGTEVIPVPLKEVAGKNKLVPPDHQWIRSARDIGVSFGDE